MKRKKVLSIIVIFSIIMLILSACAHKKTIQKEQQFLINYIKNTKEIAEALFSNSSCTDISLIIKESYSILYQNLVYIKKFKQKYPKLMKKLAEINEYILNTKTITVINKFLEERGNNIIQKYHALDLQLVEKFENGLEEYLNKVKETNGEVFVSELFSIIGMLKGSVNTKKYVEKVFEERFLSTEMLSDAIYQYLKQIDIELEANMNQFLVDMEVAFLEYLKEIGEIEFLFEPQKVYDPVEKLKKIYIDRIYNETTYYMPKNLCFERIKEKIGSSLKKDVLVQGTSTVLGFIPGINFMLGLAADAAAIFYEKKLEKEVNKALSQIVTDIKNYVMEPYGLDLRNEITNFIEKYEKQREKFIVKELRKEYKAFQHDVL